MKYALHSVSYAGFWRGQHFLTLKDFINKAAMLGFDGVEIMAKRPHASLLDMDKKARKKIRVLLDDNGIECACIAGYTDFTAGMDTGMLPNDELQILYVTELAKLAAEWGCPLVRVFSGYECAGVSYAQQWGRCVKSLRECARRAAEYGVTLGIQNHHDIGVDTASMREMLREINEPNCKAMLDAWAPAQFGENLRDSVDLLAGDIAYTTVADYIRLPRFKYVPSLVSYERAQDRLQAVPMGEGFIDYTAFFTALKASGYNGYVAYEMCSEIRGGGSEDNLDRYARRFLEYMRKL
jgi:sugar phosphate isomerase/epimerase